jgi:hypothetical protein
MSQRDVPYRFLGAEELYFARVAITTRIADMHSLEEPKNALSPQDPELEFTDGGWDPYVAALLMSGGQAGVAVTGNEENDSAPVMSFSQAPGTRSGK